MRRRHRRRPPRVVNRGAARPAPSRTFWRVGWRLRWQLVPLVTLPVLLLLGWWLNGILAAGLLLAIGVLALIGLERSTDRGPAKPGVQRRVPWQLTLPILGAPAWLATTALIGLSRLTLVLLLVAWVPWACSWWGRYRIRPAGAGGPLAVRWAESAQRVLPGTVLVDEHVLRNRHGARLGYAGEIISTDRQIPTSRMIQATGEAGAWFETDPVNITIERPAKGQGNRARLVVFETNPLLGVQHWRGPDLVAGAITLGPYADSTMCRYRFYQPDWGPWHDLIAGTTGAGKSGLLNILFASSRHGEVDGQPGCFVDWACDPQHGQSMPKWADQLDWFARGVDEGLEMLKAAERVMLARNKILATIAWVDEKGRKQHGIEYFNPTPAMPLLIVTLEEAPALFAAFPEAVQIAARIGKMARKCGIKLRSLVQVPLLAELGDNTTLRSMVASGNVICFRTSDRLSGNVAFNGALGVDPFRIPREIDATPTAGMGYSLGVDARPMIFRAWWPEDVYHWATTGTTWPLDPASARAAGDAYTRRHDPDGAPALLGPDGEPVTAASSRGGGGVLTVKRTTATVAAEVLAGQGLPMSSADVVRAVHAEPGDHGRTPRGVTNALSDLMQEGVVVRTGEAGKYLYQWRATP